MWCSKIRGALANSSSQAGNMIHPFPFRQTTECPGSTKASLLLLNLKRSETHCSSLDIPFYICYLDVMDRNSTYSPITWPPKFWGKDFVSFSRIPLKWMLRFIGDCLTNHIWIFSSLMLGVKNN